MRIQYGYDVEYICIFGLWSRSMGGFSEFGARPYFGKTDFFMPQLLLNYDVDTMLLSGENEEI